MSTDDLESQSLALSRGKRNRKTTERGAEIGAELARLRKACEAKQLKEQIAAEQQTQPQDAERGVNLKFGPAEPTLTGDAELDQANQLAHKAATLICAIAHRTGVDYTREYERGEKGIPELETIIQGTSTGKPSNKGKGKARETMPQPVEESPGVTFGRSSQTIISKHNVTVRYPSSSQQSSSLATSSSKRPFDEDGPTGVPKKQRPEASQPANRPSTQGHASPPLRAAGLKYPPLRPTDTSTIVFGEKLRHPQSVEGRASTTYSTVSVRHALALPYTEDHVPSPTRRIFSSQPHPPAQPAEKPHVAGQTVNPVPSVQSPIVPTPSHHPQPAPVPPNPQATATATGVLSQPGATQSTRPKHHVLSTHEQPPQSQSQPHHDLTPAQRSDPFCAASSQKQGAASATGTSLTTPSAHHVSKAVTMPQAKKKRNPIAPPAKVHPSNGNGDRRKQASKRAPIAQGSVLAAAGTSSRAGHVPPNPPAPSAAAQGHNLTQNENITKSGRNAANVHAGRALGNNQDPRRYAQRHDAAPRGGPVPPAPVSDADDSAPGNATEGAGRPGEIAPGARTKLNLSKPTLSMFEPEIQELLKLMAERGRARVIAYGTYDHSPYDAGEKVASRDEIVVEAWVWACKQRGVNRPYLTVYGTYFDSLVTSFRSQSKTNIKPVIDQQFKFSEDTPERNITEQDKLLPDLFHYEDPKNEEHPFENPFLVKACRAVAFEGSIQWAIKYPQYFNPLPPRFIAYVLAISNHIIYAYRDGQYTKDDKLQVVQQQQSFRRYLKDLTDMQQKRRNAFNLLFTEMYDKCRDHVEKDKRPPPPIPPKQREWTPDIDEHYVSKYPVPVSDDESEVELPAELDDFPQVVEPEDPDLYDDEPDLDHDDELFSTHNSAETLGAGSKNSWTDGEDADMDDQEMAEYEDEQEQEFSEEEVADN